MLMQGKLSVRLITANELELQEKLNRQLMAANELVLQGKVGESGQCLGLLCKK
jgi:hypothetical protein